MQIRKLSLTLSVLSLGLLLSGGVKASPRLEVGALNRRIELPGLTACFVARDPASADTGLRFLSTGTNIFQIDAYDQIRPVLYRANLFGVVSDPTVGVLLCTSRGVYTTRDGWFPRRVSNMVFTRVVAAPVGGLFLRPGVGLYGFDGKQFHLVRAIPWITIESLAVAADGAVWFVGTVMPPDGSSTPSRLFVSRDREGAAVIDDPLPPGEVATAVAEYFGGVVATVDKRLQATVDGGASWMIFDQFGRADLTLTSAYLYEGQPWQALWIGVRESLGGPAPLWYDDYASGLVAQPIDAERVRHITADPWTSEMLFVADDALFIAPYRITDEQFSR